MPLPAVVPPHIQPAQLEAGQIPAGTWDAAIIGAGPAGSVAALCLARRGRRVLVLDKARFPRDKVCGDALIPDALRLLERLGLLDAVRALGHDVSTLALYSASRVRLDIPGRFVTIRRIVFDAFLAQEAVKAGAVLARAAVTGFETAADGSVTLELAGRARIDARAAVVATGANVELLARHGRVRRTRPSAMALRCYVESAERIEELIISYDREIVPGYAWIFPLGGGLYNVGCGRVVPERPARGMNLRRDFAAFTRGFPAARALMARASTTTRLEGAMLRCGLEGTLPAGPGRSLAVGEVIGATFPLTGEGIGKAMETGALAAEALDTALDGAPSGLGSYETRLREEIAPKYLGYVRAQRWLAWPRVGDFLVRRASQSPY
ncbi:MAG TPA: NAD(P)/FAD-dependent oxidoreductase, partial [Vicinamibacterales bacterium]